MFRILIVEDIIGVLRQLAEFLSEALSESETERPKVDTAETVREAKNLIETAYFNRRPYHAVLLDFNLPMDRGHHPEIDESLCLAVRDLMPTALVVHISAFIKDEQIERHMEKLHIETIDRSFTLSKLNVNYPLQLVGKLKAFLYGARIEGQIDSLFGWASGSEAEGRKAESSLRDRRVTTHQLAALSRDIVSHWKDLDGPVRERVQKLFDVDGSADPIRISLL